MNWGKGIVIVLGSFMIFILILAVTMMRQNVNLESDDYYKKEINYEQEITAMRNANKLDEKIKVQVTEDYVMIQVPQEGKYASIQVFLQRPDNNKLDKTFTFNDTRSFLIEKSKLTKGVYNVEISYTLEGKMYLQKESLYI
jgi:hypothetical protein